MYASDYESLKILIEYANRHNIILKINDTVEENRYYQESSYPISYLIKQNDLETSKLLINYAKEHKIVLKFNTSVDRKNIEKYVKNTELKILLDKQLRKYRRYKLFGF